MGASPMLAEQKLQEEGEQVIATAGVIEEVAIVTLDEAGVIEIATVTLEEAGVIEIATVILEEVEEASMAEALVDIPLDQALVMVCLFIQIITITMDGKTQIFVG